jgi:hypothetical protein
VEITPFAGWQFWGKLSIASGGKYYFSERFGVSGQGHLLMTFVNSSGGMLCSLPGGCLAGMTGQAFIQGNLTAGLVLVL